MMNYTAHYNLGKPRPEDFYNIADFNRNADLIDAALRSGAVGLDGKMSTGATPPLRNAVTGDSPIAGRWYRVASISVPTANQNATISMHVAQISTGLPHHSNGVLRLDLRTGPPNTGLINWEYLNGLDPADFILAHNNVLPAVAELWTRVRVQNQHYRFDVIAEGDRNGNTAPIWTLHNRASAATQITAGLTQRMSEKPESAVAAGTYNGAGNAEIRFFDLGFRPKAVVVSDAAVLGSDTVTYISVEGSFGGGGRIVIEDNGFSLHGGANSPSGRRFNYIAFR
jgi:hypothetical protein